MCPITKIIVFVGATRPTMVHQAPSDCRLQLFESCQGRVADDVLRGKSERARASFKNNKPPENWRVWHIRQLEIFAAFRAGEGGPEVRKVIGG